MRARGTGTDRGEKGFTLLEVIIAVAILGISLVLIMQLFSAGLRSARASCDFTRAVVHAKDKMEELSHSMTNDSGDFEDGFRWETTVQDYKEEIGDTPYSLVKLMVKIYWPGIFQRQKTYELISLRAMEGDRRL
jgi:general secretion pathway protein I